MQADFILFMRSQLLDDPLGTKSWFPETLLHIRDHSGPFEVFARSQTCHHTIARQFLRIAQQSIRFLLPSGNTISGIFVHSEVMSDHGHMSVWSTYRFTGHSANTCVPKTSLHEAPQVPESTTLLDARYFPAVNGWISFLCYLAWVAIRENDHRLLFVAKQTIEVCNSAVGTCPMVDERLSCS